jgi:anti-sigma B factor antagonist
VLLIAESKTRSVEPGITVVEISGRLTLGNSLQSLETSVRRLIEEGSRKLIFDLAGLDAVDSAGLGMLIGANGLMEQSGGKVRISGARGSVAKILGVVHLDRLMALDPDCATACGKLA